MKIKMMKLERYEQDKERDGKKEEREEERMKEIERKEREREREEEERMKEMERKERESEEEMERMKEEIESMRRRNEQSEMILANSVMYQGVVDISNILARKVLEEAEPYYPSISSVREHVRKMKDPQYMIILNKILQEVGLTPDLERRLNQMKKVYCLNESAHPVLFKLQIQEDGNFFQENPTI